MTHQDFFFASKWKKENCISKGRQKPHQHQQMCTALKMSIIDPRKKKKREMEIIFRSYMDRHRENIYDDEKFSFFSFLPVSDVSLPPSSISAAFLNPALSIHHIHLALFRLFLRFYIIHILCYMKNSTGKNHPFTSNKKNTIRRFLCSTSHHYTHIHANISVRWASGGSTIIEENTTTTTTIEKE